MNSDKRAIIVTALLKAAEAGKAAMAGDDGGTCNFDSAIVRFVRIREADVKSMLAECGLSGYKHGPGRWFVSLATEVGQGNRRTRVAEALVDSLRCETAYDFAPGVHYDLD